MDLFREWLGPTVEQHLGEVLEWRSKSEVNRSQLAGNIGHITFDDDGSNLRIRSAKKPVVQIIKVSEGFESSQRGLALTECYSSLCRIKNLYKPAFQTA